MITIKPKAVFPAQLPKYEYNTQALMAELGTESLYRSVYGQLIIDTESAT